MQHDAKCYAGRELRQSWVASAVGASRGLKRSFSSLLKAFTEVIYQTL